MKPTPKIEMLAVEHLIPYANNSRTHSDAQIAQIAASIKEFGFTNPVLIDGEGGIIAGHGRVLAARRLHMLEVPCIRLTHLTDAQRRAYVIADNKIAINAGWDEEMLALEIGDLSDSGFDLAFTGFNNDEIEALLASVKLVDMPLLPTGDKQPFQQMTFTLHDSQAAQVVAAMKSAAAMGPYIDSPNENGNGNALSRVCEVFLSRHGKR